MESGVKEDMWIMLLKSGRQWCPNGSQRRHVRGQGSADRHSLPRVHLWRGQWWWAGPLGTLEYLGRYLGVTLVPWGGLIKAWLPTYCPSGWLGVPWLWKNIKVENMEEYLSAHTCRLVNYILMLCSRPKLWPHPGTKDWLCQQFRCATMLIVPQQSY